MTDVLLTGGGGGGVREEGWTERERESASGKRSGPEFREEGAECDS